MHFYRLNDEGDAVVCDETGAEFDEDGACCFDEDAELAFKALVAP